MPKDAKAAEPAATVITLQPRPSPPMSQGTAALLTAFEPLLDLAQAAVLLGMHWKTLETMARAHRIPALKVGKRWRFRASALNRWLEDGINSNTTNHAALTGKG
jgi:excisionase family DNA binding protein